MSPAACETPDKMSGGPTGKMPVLQQLRGLWQRERQK